MVSGVADSKDQHPRDSDDEPTSEGFDEQWQLWLVPHSIVTPLGLSSGTLRDGGEQREQLKDLCEKTQHSNHHEIVDG